MQYTPPTPARNSTRITAPRSSKTRRHLSAVRAPNPRPHPLRSPVPARGPPASTQRARAGADETATLGPGSFRPEGRGAHEESGAIAAAGHERRGVDGGCDLVNDVARRRSARVEGLGGRRSWSCGCLLEVVGARRCGAVVGMLLLGSGHPAGGCWTRGCPLWRAGVGRCDGGLLVVKNAVQRLRV